MTAAELQTIIDREARQREAARNGGRTVCTSVEQQVADVVAAFQAKHGKLEHVPSPAEPGPQTQQALKVVAAINRARAGNIIKASSEAFGTHKLPTYVVNGRS